MQADLYISFGYWEDPLLHHDTAVSTFRLEAYIIQSHRLDNLDNTIRNYPFDKG